MSSHPISLWRQSSNKLRQSEKLLEYFCLMGLFLAALILFLVNLGSLPLTDWDESIVAQVAKEIAQSQEGTWHWIFPTLWGNPYLAQPPLIHNLIALTYSIGGINEFTTRLPGAILTAISVLLVYSIGREIFIARIPALLSALIYLTCLPVVRLGRMAMLDGPLLCFEILAIWAILRSRRDLRWTLVGGIGFGLVGLTKGIFSLQVMAIALLFLFWDTPRLLNSVYLWTGIGLGVLPFVSWYAAQWYHYSDLFNLADFVGLFVSQAQWTLPSLERSPWLYLLVLIEYSLPWLLVFWGGLQLARTNLHWGWGKLIVVWSGVCGVVFLMFFTEQPWYVLPLYPALALAGGAKLDLIRNLPSYGDYPANWSFGFGLMSVLAGFASVYFGIRHYIDFSLPLIFCSIALTFGVTAIFLAKKEIKFLILLFWGLYVSLFLLFNSPHWIWELEMVEPVEPVKPIAAFVKQYVPPGEIVYTSTIFHRPSLSFYSNRQILAQTNDQLQKSWQYDGINYLLLDRQTLTELNFDPSANAKRIDSQSHRWTILIKNQKNK